MSNDAVAFLTFITLVGGFVLLFPVVRALSERLKGRADPGLRDEVQALREDLVTELQLMRQQMGELTDRVEFTERLIAKQRVGQRVGPGE